MKRFTADLIDEIWVYFVQKYTTEKRRLFFVDDGHVDVERVGTDAGAE